MGASFTGGWLPAANCNKHVGQKGGRWGGWSGLRAANLLQCWKPPLLQTPTRFDRHGQRVAAPGQRYQSNGVRVQLAAVADEAAAAVQVGRR